MPTIDQLPVPAQAVSAADEVPIVQLVDGVYVTGRAAIGTLLALMLNQGAGTTVPLLPSGAPPGVSDNVVMVQGGTADLVPYAQVINGAAISDLATAAAASDGDTFPVSQGGSSLLSQSMAPVSRYIQTKWCGASGFKPVVQEIFGNLSIDATYANKLLVVTAIGAVVTPNAALMGSGFECEIVTSGPGTVIWGAGVTATNAGAGLGTNSYAKLLVFTSSAGTVALANVGASTSGGVSAPGPVTGLTLGTVTSSSLAFSWTAPATGGTATYYQVQYRVYGSGGAWTAVANTGTASVTIGSLTAGTQYDVEVAANNSGGVASSYVVYGQSPVATTSASSGTAPNVPTALTAGTPTNTAVPLSWTAPASGATVDSYTVQWSLHGANSWTSVTGISGTGTTVGGLSSGTEYDFQVAAVGSGGAASSFVPSTPVSATTASYAITVTWANNWGPATPTSIAAGWAPGGGLIFNCATTPPTGSTEWVVYTTTTTLPAVPTTANNSTIYAMPSSELGANDFGAYVSPPPAAGTYYVWGLVVNGGAFIGTLMTGPITITA